jgi:hypothetical protein
LLGCGGIVCGFTAVCCAEFKRCSKIPLAEASDMDETNFEFKGSTIFGAKGEEPVVNWSTLGLWPSSLW